MPARLAGDAHTRLDHHCRHRRPRARPQDEARLRNQCAASESMPASRGERTGRRASPRANEGYWPSSASMRLSTSRLSLWRSRPFAVSITVSGGTRPPCGISTCPWTHPPVHGQLDSTVPSSLTLPLHTATRRLSPCAAWTCAAVSAEDAGDLARLGRQDTPWTISSAVAVTMFSAASAVIAAAPVRSA